jgi:hypothetical protein
MKDLFAENFENFWKNVVCERFWELLFSKNTISGKIFAFRKIFFMEALEWKGAQIWNTPPPTRNRLARPWSKLYSILKILISNVNLLIISLANRIALFCSHDNTGYLVKYTDPVLARTGSKLIQSLD